MIRYAPANLFLIRRPSQPSRLSQAAALATKPALRLPSPAIDLGIMAVGTVISLLGFYNRQSPLGAIALGVGGSVAGAGLVLLFLDLIGSRNSTVPA